MKSGRLAAKTLTGAVKWLGYSKDIRLPSKTISRALKIIGDRPGDGPPAARALPRNSVKLIKLRHVFHQFTYPEV
jgi:hypothetical protein